METWPLVFTVRVKNSAYYERKVCIMTTIALTIIGCAIFAIIGFDDKKQKAEMRKDGWELC